LAGRLAATLKKSLKGRADPSRHPVCLRLPNSDVIELERLMPIKIPDTLPARETLVQEGVAVLYRLACSI